MSGLSARGFSPCSPDFRYSRRSARFRPPSRRRRKGCRPAEPEPTQAAPPSPTGAPPTPASPFGLSPETFPGIFGGRPPPAAAPPFGAPAPPESPFGFSPDIFPGILGGRPDRRTLEQPALPSSEPGISPGISPGTSPGAPSGVPTAPAAAPSEAAQSPEQGAPVAAPQPGLATTPELVPPFLTPPYGFERYCRHCCHRTRPRLRHRQAYPRRRQLSPLLPACFRLRRMIFAPRRSCCAGCLGIRGVHRQSEQHAPEVTHAYARLRGSTVISVDTVRLQGQLSGGIDYLNYARDSDQDRLNANLAAFGLGTVVQDHIFIDRRAAITQASQNGGLGFAGPELISRSQQTQLITASVAPIARYSFGGYVDAELRYNYAMSLFDQGSLFGGSDTTTPSTTNLSNAIGNEVTLALASGRMFTYFGSRLTLDALKID